VFDSSDQQPTENMPVVSLTDTVSIPQPSPSYPINTHLGVSEILTIDLGSA
jgi:hypothetical protein